MWTHEDNGSDVNWKQAQAYCANLRLGGYSNWRLASIDELGGIYDETNDSLTSETRTHYHIKGGIKLSDWWVWGSAGASGEASDFSFVDGLRDSAHRYYPDFGRALCVRSPGR